MSSIPRTLLGGGYSEAERLAIWSKGRIIPNFHPLVWRWDRFGNVMRYDDYGNTTKFGWEVDHVVPSGLGGHDGFNNLMPTHWGANRAKGHRFIG